ncbi:MAG TPA: flavin reductase family protein [Bacillales bacterium]|nr:flavin reductase family protein [Bacillales bacterium]
MIENKILPESVVIEPKILYYGTPVVLLSTLNEDGTTNVTPMSSSWALGRRIVLGLGVEGKAVENLNRCGECVVNVADPSLWHQVETLAPFTGRREVPDEKRKLGYRHEKNKFAAAGLTEQQSREVQPDRVAECPLQIEAVVKHIRIPDDMPFFAVIEVDAVCVHAHQDIVTEKDHVSPEKWSPLIYNFRHYFGLGPELGKSFKSET